MDSQDDGFKPPYMSFQTFWNFVSDLGRKPLPPRIDRSVMAGKSGTDQANLFQAFTSFGLIDNDTSVLPLLEQLTSAEEEQRKSILAKMVADNYVGPMRVSSINGSSKDLDNAFVASYPSIASADTRRKAITFFLHAARIAGLELSVHFPKTRSGPGAPGTTKPRKATRRKPAASDAERMEENGSGNSAPAGDTYSFQLNSGGTIFAVVDVDIFQLSTTDRNYVMDLVDKLKGYPPKPVPGAAEGTQNPPLEKESE